MSARKILVVDDDMTLLENIRKYLTPYGYDVKTCSTCATAEQEYFLSRPDLAVLDYSLPDGNSLTLIEKLHAIDRSVPVIVLTAHASIDLAVDSIKQGAEQFLTKPIELPALRVVIERTLENYRLSRKQVADNVNQARQAFNPFIGTSRKVQHLRTLAEKVCASDAPILITGETGTGKGVLSRWIHENSRRAGEPSVDLNCAGLSKEFLETELFGHEKGAFTGAVVRKQGLLEVADRGTIFLDEIGDMDMQVQPKLLKVLEDKRFRRLGDVKDREVDVRLIAATHHDLEERVKGEHFREDLYYRINTITLDLPPLRERREDIPALAEYMMERLRRELGLPDVELSGEAVERLQELDWKGNLREMRNTLERATLLRDDDKLTADDFSGASVTEKRIATSYPTDLSLEELEFRHIKAVLGEENGKVANAATRLKVPLSTLYQKIKRMGIKTGE